MINKSQAGYTILELLIAVTLISVLSVLLTSGIHFGARVWERSSDRRQSWMESANGYQFIKTRLAAAEEIRMTGRNGNSVSAFWGAKDQMSFVNTDLGKAGFLGDQLLTIKSVPGSKNEQLVVRRGRFGQASNSADSEELTLVPDIGRVEFSYFGPSANGQPPTWQQDWDERQTMPWLVKATILQSGESQEQIWVFPLPRP